MRLLELQHHPHRRRLRGHGYFKRLGPGIVTGAADDDPSGIGTYSQVGAAFGFGLLWTTLATLPLAVAVQEATARLGLVTGKGLAALIRERFARPVLVGAVVLVAVANTFNIGADTPYSVNELAREVVLSPTATSRFIDRVEMAGHVRREPDPADEREFVRRLESHGIPTTVRDTRGREIDGACGQLAAVTA